MKKIFLKILLIISVSVLTFSGCLQFALRLSPTLFPNLASSIFEECDPELAKSSIPANMKLLEGLLKGDPKNRQILTTLCMGFCGYSLLFVEADNPERASDLYLRSRDYGIKALGEKGLSLKDLNIADLESALMSIGEKEIEALLWTSISWNAWINLNLDKPAALAQLRSAQACLERVVEIDPDYRHGLPRILMGANLSARSRMFGGDTEKAKNHFEKALNLSDRKYFLAQYYFARYYAVRVQDRELFSKLIKEIIQGDPYELRDVCLINRVMHVKAQKLREMSDELFI
ncbi:MAG: hypothetical protein JRC68_01765 [Deltaproteobacteria bacterium]|nr:hypothetical protein [Deltaproteobacteria bacterium]